MNNLVKALVAAGIMIPIVIGVVFLTMEKDPLAPTPTDNDAPATVTSTAGEGGIKTPLVEKPTVKVTLTGVTRLKSGSPLPGVEVQAIPVGSAVRQALTHSDDEGRFTLSELPVGRYRIRGRRAGFQESRRDVTVQEGENPSVELVFESGLAISGHVRNISGEGIADATVTAFVERAKENGNLVENIKVLLELDKIDEDRGVSARTDADGWYQITGLETEKYRLDAVAREHAPATRRFVPSGTSDADFLLEPGGILPGLVVGSDGPVAGAVVRVYRQVTTQKDVIEEIVTRLRPPLAERTTDADGMFSFNELGGADTYRVVVEAGGYQPAQVDKVVVNPGRNTELVITLDPGASISGIVLDPESRPLPGARIKCNLQGGRPKVQTNILDKGILTDENGEFAYDTLEEGADYRIVVSHEKYSSFQQNRVKPGGEVITVILGRGGAIEGTITDSQTGRPIAGATVTVRDIADVQKTGISDASGKYYVGGLTPLTRNRSTHVSVEADGYARLSNQSIQVEEETVLSGRDFALERNAQIAGVVVDGGGRPIPQCEVTVKRQHSPNVPVVINVAETTLTDDQGRFVLQSVAPGKDSFLYGHHDSYLDTESERFEVAVGENRSGMKLTLRVGGSVEGIVVDENGRPVEGVTVAVQEEHLNNIDIHALRHRTETDASGSFQLTSLEAGSHTLLAEAEGYLGAQHPDTLVEEGLLTPNVQIVLQRGGTLSGSVTDVFGNALRNANVTYVDTSAGLRKKSTRTDSNGEYRFDDLGQEPVRVEAELAGYTKVQKFDVAPNSSEVDFQLQRLGAIQGMVYNQAGEPVRAFSVNPKLTQQGREVSKFPARTFSNGDGSFIYRDIDPGSYKIIFGAPGYGPSILENIRVQPDTITELPPVTLSEGGKVSGYILEGDTGRPIAGAQVSVIGAKFVSNAAGVYRREGGPTVRRQGTSVSNRDGYFEIVGLASPTITLKVQHRGYVEQNLREVASGTHDLQIYLDSGGTIEGTVFGTDGQPIRGRQILLTGGTGLSDRKISDRKGYYRFTGLPAGTYTLRLTQIGLTKGRVDLQGAPTVTVEVGPGLSTRQDLYMQ